MERLYDKNNHIESYPCWGEPLWKKIQLAKKINCSLLEFRECIPPCVKNHSEDLQGRLPCAGSSRPLKRKFAMLGEYSKLWYLSCGPSHLNWKTSMQRPFQCVLLVIQTRRLCLNSSFSGLPHCKQATRHDNHPSLMGQRVPAGGLFRMEWPVCVHEPVWHGPASPTISGLIPDGRWWGNSIQTCS
jgi:hypothetical protein